MCVIFCWFWFILAADCQGTNKKDYVALNMVTSEKLHSDETALKKLDEGSPKVNLGHLCQNVVNTK